MNPMIFERSEKDVNTELRGATAAAVDDAEGEEAVEEEEAGEEKGSRRSSVFYMNL